MPQSKKKVISIEICILICTFILSDKIVRRFPSTWLENKRSKKDVI